MNVAVITLNTAVAMIEINLKTSLEQFDSSEGLTFLELLSHNLTIQVRVAAGRRSPYGPCTEDETRDSMYWINESLHDNVQITRDIRIGSMAWDSDDILSCMQGWLNSTHAAPYVESAINATIREVADKT